jgi:hypothetical protein
LSRDEGDLPTVPEIDARVPQARSAAPPPVSEAEARLVATMVRRSFTVSAWALAVMAVGIVLAAVGDPAALPLIGPAPALLEVYAVVLATKARGRDVRRAAVWAVRLSWSTLLLALVPTIPFLLFAGVMSQYQG